MRARAWAKSRRLRLSRDQQTQLGKSLRYRLAGRRQKLTCRKSCGRYCSPQAARGGTTVVGWRKFQHHGLMPQRMTRRGKSRLEGRAGERQRWAASSRRWIGRGAKLRLAGTQPVRRGGVVLCCGGARDCTARMLVMVGLGPWPDPAACLDIFFFLGGGSQDKGKGAVDATKISRLSSSFLHASPPLVSSLGRPKRSEAADGQWKRASRREMRERHRERREAESNSRKDGGQRERERAANVLRADMRDAAPARSRSHPLIRLLQLSATQTLVCGSDVVV